MSKLIMIAGNSGTGKTYLINHIHLLGGTYRIIQKKTTRIARDSENSNQSVELIFGIKKEDILKMDFSYKFRKDYYGFNAEDIDAALRNNINAIMVVRYVEFIKMLKERYSSRAIAIYCKSIMCRNDIRVFLSQRGFSDLEIHQRLIEQYEAPLEKEYLDNMDIFDYVISNNYDDNFLWDLKSYLSEIIL